ncbi:Transcriptional regulator, AraC family [Pseudomonas sessilinigenes]|nr:Transcriptional regulator, AraC family [Pseudomonas sessilinigenes]
MSMDPLSEVLALLNTRSSVFAGLKAGGDWAIDFPAPDGIKFNALIEGSCWLTVEGAGAPVRLVAGDCFLLSRKRAFSLCSDPELPAIRADEVYRHASNGVAHCGSADELFLIGGRFAFGEEANLLFAGLPALAVIGNGSEPASVLNWALQHMAHELAGSSPGHSIVVQHLGHIMLVQVLRMYLAQATDAPPSWLLAICDPRIGAVIEAIHADPARAWTVEDLARIARVSRSTLALHFKQKAGIAPLEYLLRWRMQLATQSLKSGRASISSIAQKLGYDSDSAFSHAFKRIMHCSPRQYRERQAHAI